jgi:hypothetical protein
MQHLLSRCSATWAMPPVIFSFSYFSGWVSHFCPVLASDCDPPAYTLPLSWNLRNVPSCQSYSLKWHFTNFLPELSLNCDLPNLHLTCSWDYRCDGVQFFEFFIYCGY